MSPGERRRRARKNEEAKARWQAAVALLQANGSNCGNCRHADEVQSLGLTCDLGSDFHGYQKVKPDYVCPQWAAKAVRERRKV